MDTDRLAVLRELLAAEPSVKGWEQLLDLFRAWPASTHDFATGVDYAREHLTHWDDALRVISHQELGTAYGPLGRSLQYEWFEPVALSSLLSVESFRELSILRLCVVPEQVDELLASPFLPSPKELNLNGSEFTTDALQRLLHSPLTANVESLLLADVSLEEEGLGCLIQAPCFAQLRTLDLSHNYLDDKALMRLSQTPSCEGLERLSLRHNPMGDGAAQALASSPYLRSLTHLLMDPPPGQWLGAKGLLSLVYSPHLTNLQELS